MMLKNLLNFLITLFSQKREQEKPNVPEKVQSPQESEEKLMEIDWTDPTAKISKYFTVKEALYLPSWDVMHIPTEEQKANIVKMAAVMDKIRNYLGKPIIIHVWIRPILNKPGHERDGQDYSPFIKGAKMSAHKDGRAVDWHCKDYNCDYVRRLLLQKLEEYDIRVEDLPGSNWVHTDIKPPVNNNRYFKP